MMISSEGYLIGASVIASCLRSFGLKGRDMVLLMEEDMFDNLSKETREHLKKDGWIMKPVPRITNPYAAYSNIKSQNVFTKLHIFNPKYVGEYGKVLFLDADTLPVADLSSLFSCSGFLCFASSTPNEANWNIANTGVLVISPLPKAWKEIEQAVSQTPENYNRGDQGFLNSFLRGWCQPGRSITEGCSPRAPVNYASIRSTDGSRFFSTATNPTKADGCGCQELEGIYNSNPFEMRTHDAPAILHFNHREWVLKPWRWWTLPLVPAFLPWYLARFSYLPSSVGLAGPAVGLSITVAVATYLSGATRTETSRPTDLYRRPSCFHLLMSVLAPFAAFLVVLLFGDPYHNPVMLWMNVGVLATVAAFFTHRFIWSLPKDLALELSLMGTLLGALFLWFPFILCVSCYIGPVASLYGWGTALGAPLSSLWPFDSSTKIFCWLTWICMFLQIWRLTFAAKLQSSDFATAKLALNATRRLRIFAGDLKSGILAYRRPFNKGIRTRFLASIGCIVILGGLFVSGLTGGTRSMTRIVSSRQAGQSY